MGLLKRLFLGDREQQLDRELMLEAQINAQYDEFCHYRQEWKEGKRSPSTHTIAEWEYLQRPTLN